MFCEIQKGKKKEKELSQPVKAGQYLCEKLGLMWGDDKI